MIKGKSAIRVEGVDSAIRKLNKKFEQYKVNTVQELVRIGMMIQRESQENIKDDGLIDTGNMRASAFITWTDGPLVKDAAFSETGRKSGSRIDSTDMDLLNTVHKQTVNEATIEVNSDNLRAQDKASVIVGYGAYYSLFVHEDGVSRKWTGAKFLQKAVERMSAKFETMMINGLRGKLR